jgi:hypothetical protein
VLDGSRALKVAVQLRTKMQVGNEICVSIGPLLHHSEPMNMYPA